jgi:hypothetical protein
MIIHFALYALHVTHKKNTGSGQSLPQTLPGDLDLGTGMGYLRHGVSWVDSSPVHWEAPLWSHSLLGLPVLSALLLLALFAKIQRNRSDSLMYRNWVYQL